MTAGFIVGLLLLVAVLGLLVWALALKRSKEAALGREPSTPVRTMGEDSGRRAASQRLGDELLERRVSLDTSRGPLGGDAELDSRLDELAHRRQNRELTEDEYEREKIRLLGG